MLRLGLYHGYSLTCIEGDTPRGGTRRLGCKRASEPLWCSMSKSNPVEFLQEVRSEAKKVTWPSKKETMITTGMVLLMAFLASLFFLFVDQIIAFLLSFVLAR